MTAKIDSKTVHSNHKSLYKLYSRPVGWCGASDSFIESRIHDLPKWISGIGSQAFEDFSEILTEFRDNCVVLGITCDIWAEFQYLRSNSDYDSIQADDLVQFLHRYGLTSDQYTELDGILSEKFNKAKMLRISTFFRGVCMGASSKDVKAALDYLYGNTQLPRQIPKNRSNIFYKFINIFY